jgi:hypothetical protein
LRQGRHHRRPVGPSRIAPTETSLWAEGSWLAGLKFAQPVHHIRREDYIAAVEAAAARRDRLTAQIERMLADWTLAPVAAMQTMRGMAPVDPASLAAELGDLSRFANPRRLMAYLGLVRNQHQTRRSDQGRQRRRTSTADRGGLALPLPGAGQPSVAAPPGGATEADPRDRLEGAPAAVRATASSPAPVSRPMSSSPRSPASWRASSGPSPGG